MTQLVNYFDYGFIWAVEIKLFSENDEDSDDYYQPLIYACKTPDTTNYMLNEVLEALEEKNLKESFPILKTIPNYTGYVEKNLMIVLKIKDKNPRFLFSLSTNWPVYLSNFRKWTTQYLK